MKNQTLPPVADSTTPNLWRPFKTEQPPLGTKVLIQAHGWKPIEFTFNCPCHENATGMGADFSCFINYPGQSKVHVSYLMWKYLPLP